MTSFLLEINCFSDIMQKTCTLCQLLIQSQFSGHDAGKSRYFRRMLQNILPIAIAITQTAKQLCQLTRHPIDTELENRFITNLHDGFIQLAGHFFNNLFNSARLNTPIFHQDFQCLAGNFTTNRIEARHRNHIRGIINDQINAGCLLNRLDISSFTADNSPLHVLIRQRHNRNGAVDGFLLRISLNCCGNDIARLIRRFFACQLVLLMQIDGDFFFAFFSHNIHQFPSGIFLTHFRHFFQNHNLTVDLFL